MRARFLIESPNEIEATMKITMTVKEWTELRDQLQQKWPSSQFCMAITSVITQARKTYYAPEHDAC
jgi:hypothetical protein